MTLAISIPKDNWRFTNDFSYNPCREIFFGGYDKVYTEDTLIEVVEPAGLFIGLMLSGSPTSIQMDGVGEIEIPVGRPVVLAFSEETLCTNKYNSGDFCAGVGLHIKFCSHPETRGRSFGKAISYLEKRFGGQADLEILPRSSELLKLAEQAFRIPNTAGFYELEIEAVLLNFLAALCQIAEESHQYKGLNSLTLRERKRVKSVIEFLRENLEHTPSLNDLAQLTGVNPGTLADNFKTAYGKTIFAYYRDLRLQTAQSILRSESTSVTEAGMRVGYSSSAAFSTAYRKQFGRAPSQEIQEKM